VKQSSTLAPTVDIHMLRLLVAELTAKRVSEYCPGRARKAYKCGFCGKVFASRSIRQHVPRCEAKPSRQRKTWNETALNAKRLTLLEVSALVERDCWLNTGVQGAD
jgi:hypothetical protein